MQSANLTETEKKQADETEKKKREEEERMFLEIQSAAWREEHKQLLQQQVGKKDELDQIPDDAKSSIESDKLIKALPNGLYDGGNGKHNVILAGKSVSFRMKNFDRDCGYAMKLLQHAGAEVVRPTFEGINPNDTSIGHIGNCLETFLNEAEKLGMEVTFETDDGKLLPAIKAYATHPNFEKHFKELEERRQQVNAKAMLVKEAAKHGISIDNKGVIQTAVETSGEFNNNVKRLRGEKLEVAYPEEKLKNIFGDPLTLNGQPLSADKTQRENQLNELREKALKESVLKNENPATKAKSDRTPTEIIDQVTKEFAKLDERLKQVDKVKESLNKDAVQCEEMLKDNRFKTEHIEQFEKVREKGEVTRTTLFNAIENEQKDLSTREKILTAIVEDLKNTLNQEITNLNSSNLLSSQNETKLISENQKLDAENTDFRKKKEVLENDLNNPNADKVNLQKNIDVFTAKINKNEAEIKKNQDEITKIKESIKKNNEQIDKKNEEIKKLDINKMKGKIDLTLVSQLKAKDKDIDSKVEEVKKIRERQKPGKK